MNTLQSSPFHRKSLRKVAILGNFLPRRCGIATFTFDLVEALAGHDSNLEIDVLAMSDREGYAYPSRVRHQIPADDKDAYRKAAGFLNKGAYDVLSVQHEYGIFGGKEGNYLLTLLRELQMPIVPTMHTVLRDPTVGQRAVTMELLQLSERVVVMSAVAVDILQDVYGASPQNVDVIPHGIPNFGVASRTDVKDFHGIKGAMILTFGLLSPDKGIQYAIEAMPKILENDPGAVYVVLGATHPNIRATSGEQYRMSLKALAEELGVRESVLFIDRFVSHDELVDYLQAADVYVTPYLNPRQITSGTLAYALGAGKSVVSTPYLYAEELLAEGRGVLVPFRDGGAIADAVADLHSDDSAQRQQTLGDYCRPMRWPAVGKGYLECLDAARTVAASRLASLNVQPWRKTTTSRLRNEADWNRLEKERRLAWPPIPLNGLPDLNLDHLARMTDTVGLFQHAALTVPNPDHGYCVDDNARALLLTAILEMDRSLPDHVRDLQGLYLEFVRQSFNHRNRRFRNFKSHGGQWLDDQGSDDSHARSLWSLGAVVRRSGSAKHRTRASELFERAFLSAYEMRSPRAWAFTVLAAAEYLAAWADSLDARSLQQEMAGRLWREYRSCRGPGWLWFEEVVSYDNARLSQALIVAGEAAGNHPMVEDGLESLGWLMTHQKSSSACFAPIGSNGFWKRGGEKAVYDQQPLEAWASISACISASQATGDHMWMLRAACAFEWFLGGNELGEPIYDPRTGGCRDGIHPRRVNENQGAESTLSFLCSLAELKAASGLSAGAAASKGVAFGLL